jgi:hypothetical protein
MRRIADTVLLSVISLFFVSTAVYASEGQDEARSAALQWLAHMDAGEYDRAWEEAAELFKSELAPEVWQTAATNVRSPLGALVARSYRSARHTTRVPGFPQAEYFVIVYFSRFEGRPDAEETVTMMNDDGDWRAVNYYIR